MVKLLVYVRVAESSPALSHSGVRLPLNPNQVPVWPAGFYTPLGVEMVKE